MRILLAAAVLGLAGCATLGGEPAGVGGFDNLPAQRALPGLAQKLLDALPADKGTWDRALSRDAVYVGEDGEVAGKKDLLDSFHPFPAGLSGSIKVMDPKVTDFGDVAAIVFNALEEETVFDQHIQVEYLTTQVWRREDRHWQLLVTQSAVRPRDPAPSQVSRARLQEYVGTYELGDWKYRVESPTGDSLVGGSGDELTPLIAVGDNVFAEAGNPLGTLRIFLKGGNGRVDRMIQRRKFADLTWQKLAQ